MQPGGDKKVIPTLAYYDNLKARQTLTAGGLEVVIVCKSGDHLLVTARLHGRYKGTAYDGGGATICCEALE